MLSRNMISRSHLVIVYYVPDRQSFLPHRALLMAIYARYEDGVVDGITDFGMA
jgi:hypothetical protein